MHIPDGYLSPQTCAVMYGAAAPFWYVAGRRVKRALSSRAAPYVAIFAAFSFTIQMFNIPLPGGTTGHAVGGTLMAIVLGPSAAIVGLTVALIIQALFFGDGGVTAIGANAFNMGIALPLAGYAVYSLISSGEAPSARRRVVAAAIGSYLAINVAGLLVAVELGVQPLLWHDGARPLYNPYGLETTLPAMALAHLTVAGLAEAALTAVGVSYLLRAHPSLFVKAVATEGENHARGALKPALPLVLLVLLVPVGLLSRGTAAFEWGAEELEGLIGYVPAGLAGLSDLWRWAPLPDYQLPRLTASGDPAAEVVSYVLAAALGGALIFLVLIGARIAARRGRAESGAGEERV